MPSTKGGERNGSLSNATYADAADLARALMSVSIERVEREKANRDRQAEYLRIKRELRKIENERAVA